MAHCVQEMFHNEPFLIMNMFYVANYWDYFSFATFKKKMFIYKMDNYKIVKIHAIDHRVFLSFSNKTRQMNIFLLIFQGGAVF